MLQSIYKTRRESITQQNEMTQHQRPILIAGPTASGKSALALQLAQRWNGVIVNADSMQVYKDLRIITARPSVEEENIAPHALYGHVDGGELYSVGLWLKDASAVLEQHKGRRLVFVGGTGLYFDALTKGISTMPDVDDAVRQHWREQSHNMTVNRLHDQLAARDTEMAARLKPTDTQRIVRALEVFDSTGRSLSFWQTQMSTPLLPEGCFTGIALTPDRKWLRQRIAQRFQYMMDNGALDEIRALEERQLHDALPVMKSLGVPLLRAYLRGETSLEAAVAQSILDTGRYAKRQDTWFRNRMKQWFKAETADMALKKCENM